MKKNFEMDNAADLFIDKTAPASTPASEEGAAIPAGFRLVKENKSERLQLLIRPTTKDIITRAARSQGISVNELINQVLDEYAERQGKV